MALYLFAMDHRGWLSRAVSKTVDTAEADLASTVHQIKQLCYAGLELAIARGVPLGNAGVLVDEEFGEDIARRARSVGVTLSVAIERADQEVFEPEYGDLWLSHVAKLNPDLPKVLIRHNVEADRAGLDIQLRRVRQVSDELHDAGHALMLELLVPPTSDQLALVGGDVRAFDDHVRPELTIRAVEEIRSAGIRTECWKVEGVSSVARAAELADACTHDGGGSCLVLGRNAGWDELDRWLANAAASPSFDGFAIGRTLWWESAVEFLSGTSWDVAVEQIAINYRRAVDTYETARAGV